MALAQINLHICFFVLLFCMSEATHEGGIFHFEVITSSWSECRRTDNSSDCSKSREAVCVRSSDNHTAPWYYCTDRGLERPETTTICSPCSQNCAVSQWSDWTGCDCSVNRYRNRTRDVVSPARNGGEPCPALMVTEACSCAFVGPFDSQPRTHTWKTGEWGACLALNATSQCGAGLMTREVLCVNLQGQTVAASNCLEEQAYSSVFPPTSQTYCEVPCPCVLGDWGDFSSCKPQCEQQVPTGIRIRKKPVLQAPTHGLSCPPTEEKEACSINSSSCPVYSWSSSTWSPCNFQTGATCGTGFQTRYIYCLEALNGTTRTVNHFLCEKLASTSKPVGISACNVRCPESCVVGDWSEWSECPNSCEQTYSNRTRKIILSPFQETCPHTLELRPCPILPCSRWLAQEYQPCIPTFSSCGKGYHFRDVMCVGPNDENLHDTMCPVDDRPATSVNCHKPCEDECVLSPWSEWTPCTQNCGGIVGNQTRTRQFIANGTSCPEVDANLQEIRTCSSNEMCNPPVYTLQFSPWGKCVSDGLRGSGVSPTDDVFNDLGTSCAEGGLQNRTAVCLKDGQVVQPLECPINYRKVEVQNCEPSCTRECIFSEWSPYSSCSASCGIGMQKRSRRLLQWSSTNSDSCAVDSEGLDYEYDMCIAAPCTGGDVVEGVAWFSSNWTECHLYNSPFPQANCGLGYQTRDVQCVNIGIGLFVPELECTAVEMPRPSIVQSCQVECPDKCLVTEWSELSPCKSDGIQSRQRNILPYTGCSDWRSCCPHLTSIQLQQNVTCSDPAQEREYEYIFVDQDFSSCIFDDPSKVCGVGGKRYRQKACVIKFSRNPVNESFCSGLTSSLVTEESCIVKCELDCVQSDWKPWSPCSSTCGYGLRNRTRDTITEPLEGGRECGPELEVDVCMNAPCPVLEIIPGPFSACMPTNTSASCGEGHRTRRALCRMNGALYGLEVCREMGVANFSFHLLESCTSSCPGECVVSEWGEWSPCSTNCPVGSCQRRRTREILRQSDPPCTTATQELETCYAPVNPYQWQPGPWQDCIVSFNSSAALTPGQYCGQGQKRRILFCMNGSSEIVHEQFCTASGLTKPHSVQGCSLPCPVDCVVGSFSNWSECTGCDLTFQRRQRQIIIHPNEKGAQCPELVQKRQCAPVDCVNQTLISHPPLDLLDYTAEGQCGVVLREASFSCTQNTHYVSPNKCPGAATTTEYTVLPCPSAPACVYTDWSDWSDCESLCTDPGQPFQFQYQRLVSSSAHQNLECEHAQLQVQERLVPMVNNWNNSRVMNMTAKPTTRPMNQCIDFRWVASEWNEGQRDVYCQSLTGIRVNDAACPVFIKPLSVNQTCANVSCPLHAFCSASSGQCLHTCQANFEEVESQCLPVSGCTENVHCLIPNTECDTNTGSCKCRENFVRAKTGDLCVLTGTTTAGPSTTVVSSRASSGAGDMTTASADITSEEPTDVSVDIGLPGVQLGTLHIALIAAVPLLLLIILVIVLIIITCRCSRNLERKHQQRVIQRRRIKASISSPSPTHQMMEMKRRVTDSNSSGFVEGPDAENYGLPGASFLPDGQADDCINEPAFSPPRFTGGPPIHPIPVVAPVTPGYQGNIHRETPPGSPIMRQPLPYLYRRPYFSDGGMTDMTCTTDDDETMGTASVAPSSPGSPSTSRRHIPTNIPGNSHISEGHTHSELPENPYVSMHRRSPIYARVRGSEGARSPVSPGSPGHYSKRHHLNPGERDDRIALGLDSTLVRAANQIEAGQNVATTPNSTRSSGTFSGKRRSGRRRRSHANRPHPPTTMWYQDPHYHYFNDNRRPHHGSYRSDGHYSSEHDLNSASDVEYSRRTLPSHARQSGHRHGYEDHHRHYHHSEGAHYRGDGRPSHSNYSSREGDLQRGRLSSPSGRRRPHDLSPQRCPSFHHPRDYPSSGTCQFSSPEHCHHSSENQHCHTPSDYHHHNPCPECPPHGHTHHHCCYPDRDYRYSDHDHRSSDQSRYSPERRYQSPNGTRYSSDWDQGSLERSHSSSHHYQQDSPCHQYDKRPSSISRDRHTSFKQDHPPPEFAPPVPPHNNLAPPTGLSNDDTYDYPSCYQPEAVRKLKESDKDNTSPYARPRPYNLQTTHLTIPPENQDTSPYDYPRTKSTGISTPSTSGHVTPSSPTKPMAVSNVSFTNPSYSMHQIQQERETAAADGGVQHLETSQAMESSGNHENSAVHRSLMSNQSSASLGFTPQSMTNSVTRTAPDLPPQLESSEPPVSQPTSSTPLASSLRPTPKLTIQITPSQDGSSPHASPLLAARQYTPSPLAFNSASMSDESPRTSGEID